MESGKVNFEKVLAKMALLEKMAENDISPEFLESVPSGKIEDCFAHLRKESQKHFEMLSDSVENLKDAMDKYRNDYTKIKEFTADLGHVEDKGDLRDVLRDQLTVEVYARSQYDSLLDLLEGYEKEKAVEDGEVKFVVGELKKTIKQISDEEKEHSQEVQKALDTLEPTLSRETRTK